MRLKLQANFSIAHLCACGWIFKMKLFGDDEMLQKLDQLEALLLVGWDRLLTYVKGLR
jgi:hypothetical protein